MDVGEGFKWDPHQKNRRQEGNQTKRSMTNLELSHHPTFMNEFVAAMFFPHTESSVFPHVMEQLHRIWSENPLQGAIEGKP